MASLCALGHNNQNEVKHYLLSHVMPLVPAFMPYDANCTINGITVLIK